MVSNFSSVSSLNNFTEEFVYNMVQSELQDIDFSSTNEEDYNCSITSDELEAALKSTGDTSPGPDQIPYVLLRMMNVEQRKVLLDFYNQVWSSDYVPKIMEAGNFDTTDKTWKTSKQDYLLQANSTNKLFVQNI